jgi:hypothetical protein
MCGTSPAATRGPGRHGRRRHRGRGRPRGRRQVVDRRVPDQPQHPEPYVISIVWLGRPATPSNTTVQQAIALHCSHPGHGQVVRADQNAQLQHDALAARSLVHDVGGRREDVDQPPAPHPRGHLPQSSAQHVRVPAAASEAFGQLPFGKVRHPGAGPVALQQHRGVTAQRLRQPARDRHARPTTAEPARHGIGWLSGPLVVAQGRATTRSSTFACCSALLGAAADRVARWRVEGRSFGTSAAGPAGQGCCSGSRRLLHHGFPPGATLPCCSAAARLVVASNRSSGQQQNRAAAYGFPPRGTM